MERISKKHTMMDGVNSESSIIVPSWNQSWQADGTTGHTDRFRPEIYRSRTVKTTAPVCDRVGIGKSIMNPIQNGFL